MLFCDNIFTKQSAAQHVVARRFVKMPIGCGHYIGRRSLLNAFIYKVSHNGYAQRNEAIAYLMAILCDLGQKLVLGVYAGDG